MYSIGNILTKEPVVIAGTIRSLLWVGVLLGLLILDEKALAGIALGLEGILTLFVRQTSTSTSSPTLAADTVVAVKGTEDTVTIQPTPPGPTGIEGGAGDLP